MERRDFFRYSAGSLFLPFMVENLNAKNYVRDNVSIELSKKDLFPTKTSNTKLKIERSDDFYLDQNEFIILNSIRKKLKFVQRYVGYGNFNIISFDQMLKVARYSKDLEPFSKIEKEFLEKFFYYDPSIHGFFGERISTNITEEINKKNVIKIPKTGHYLFKGHSEEVYNRMLKDIGPSLVLTSGVRSIVKQSKLFFDKLHSVEGNLTKASRSLAPPAFTYHTIADFDVGKKGFGYANFSARFALTDEFAMMRKLKYIDMRYTINNKDGVRYEPWHVKTI